MTSPAATPFEHAFPTAFAESARGLIEGAALDDLLDDLCRTVSAQLAPATLHIVSDGEEGGLVPAPPDSTTATRPIEMGDGRRWGRVALRGPAVDPDSRPDLDAIAGFVGWIVDRHGSRRRRVATVDRERQLIAGQLHDDSIQTMTAISLNLQRLARSPGIDRDQVEHLLHLANDAIDRLRHMMFALHPPDLADDGLVRTLGDYLDGFIARSGMNASVHGDDDPRTAPEMEALAFRLARGAIHNTWKHARADHLEVSVESEGDRLRITVDDDGIGFDVEPSLHEVGHAGIEYSRDLANEVGGTYELRSAPGDGTTVTIILPMS